ncbi:hypothetical protein [Ensifer adhaerens]|uniref:Uncharacterized protein n=1 Tax=Ensifer adhaerens TaxID=106592 RepID=A0A9Q8YGZ6_ENSAD|nr:hypothetical protein [Ensifer adhaerens]USJ28533.1 hypothetical protein NE863_36030 [Ensifer adhaerens]
MTHFSVIFFVVMKRWSARKLVAMFLAVFVTVGMSLSAVQATDMSVKMAMTTDMSGSTHDGCPGCPNGGGDHGMKAMMCSVVCAVPVVAVLPQGTSMPAVPQPIFFTARDSLLHGTRAPPDPYPPRTIDIG